MVAFSLAGSSSPWGVALALAVLLGALTAMNAANTFDNADGALSAMGALGMWSVAPAAAGALLGFLPFNANSTWRRTGTPSAYLGDAGSHLVGMLVLLHPLAWPVLLVPLFDLARLSVVRWRAGSRPWIGDRRHLAHRMAGAGLGPGSVACALALISAPGCLATAWSGAAPLPSGLGLVLSGVFYWWGLQRFPDRGAHETPSDRALAELA